MKNKKIEKLKYIAESPFIGEPEASPTDKEIIDKINEIIGILNSRKDKKV